MAGRRRVGWRVGAMALGLGLLVGLPCPLAQAVPHRGLVDGKARFEVLTPTLIRMEYAEDGRFEDRPTMTAVHRPSASFTTAMEGDDLVIRTDALTLRYRRGSGLFDPGNVRIKLEAAGAAVTAAPDWQSGGNPGNLGGWTRSLDGADGPVALRDGVLSRSGWYLLDDSKTALLTGGSPGFAVRPADRGAYQDGYFFGYGHDYQRGLRDLRTLTGPQPLLPRSAFGVWFSRYYPYSADELKGLLARFRRERIPLDTLSLDTDWKRPTSALSGIGALAEGTPGRSYAWNGWDWNTALFPDPQAFLDWLHSQGVSVTANLHPSIQTDDPQWPGTPAAAGLHTTECLLSFDPSLCGDFDWSDARQLDAYFALHRPLRAQGVDFWWLDWCCDESTVTAPGLTPDTWINSRYAQFNQDGGNRWLAFSRIGGSKQNGAHGDGDAPGAFAEHRYTMHFTGDTAATWPMLAFEAEMTAAEGNIGLSYISHDIGSFNGVPVGPIPAGLTGPYRPHLPDDLYVRWLQFGVFQPLDRLHSNHGDRLPWEYGPAARRAGAKFLRLREALIPYLYTLARQAYDTGIPMVRNLYLQWPESDEAYRHRSEYTVGENVFVAPVTTPGETATSTVWLPPGTWVDYFTNRVYQGPGTATVTTSLDTMPVFLRTGGILPTRTDYVSFAAAAPLTAVTLDIAAGANGSTPLYEDQGAGFGYQTGASATTPISYRHNGSGGTVTIGAAVGSFQGAVAVRTWTIRIRNVDRPATVHIDDRPARGWSYDEESRILTVGVTARPSEHPIIVGFS